jgi:hypothetical protein
VATERQARRFVAGFVSTTGDDFTDKAAATRTKVVAAIDSGIELQRLALEMTRADEDCVLAEVQEMRLVGKYARKWRRHTVEAGPARTAALKGIWDGARRIIAVWIAEGVAAEVLTIYGASLQILVARRIATVRRLLRPAGTNAYALWRTVALAQRWRTRAALSTRRWHGSVDEWGVRRRAFCVDASWCDLEARRFDAILRQLFYDVPHWSCPSARRRGR